ncbi:transcriptional regulator [Arthrobacter sp. MN05-02]|nr:transcriptional regulator [Arthrobacter sp. MN05-02]
MELLRKSGRRVVLTPQAEVLVGHTAELLETLERAESDLAASLTTVSGTVRVAVFQSAALALMPEALTAMKRDYPDVRVEMVQREPETALYETFARDFDLVIAEQYPGHAAPRHTELDHLPLTEDAIRLAVPPAGLDYAGISSVPEASGAAWVMEPRGAASRHWAEQACRRAGFEPDVRYETADLQAQIRLIESGNAVALMPDLVWTGRSVPVQLLDLDDSPRRSIFTSARSAGARRPAVLAVREVLGHAAAGVRRPQQAQ